MIFFKPTLRFLERTKTILLLSFWASGHLNHPSELKNPSQNGPIHHDKLIHFEWIFQLRGVVGVPDGSKTQQKPDFRAFQKP